MLNNLLIKIKTSTWTEFKFESPEARKAEEGPSHCSWWSDSISRKGWPWSEELALTELFLEAAITGRAQSRVDGDGRPTGQGP